LTPGPLVGRQGDVEALEQWLQRATQAHADALLAMAAVHRLALRAAQSRLLRGWALAMQGEAAAGVARLRQALASPDVGPEAHCWQSGGLNVPSAPQNTSVIPLGHPMCTSMSTSSS
jgi:hypothetical protein